MLMTAENYSLFESLQLFPPPNITPSDTAAALSFAQLGQRTVSLVYLLRLSFENPVLYQCSSFHVF